MGNKRRLTAILGLLLALSMIAAACGGGDDGGEAGGEPAEQATEGGTYRVQTVDFGFTGAFDPTGEYLGSAWGIFSNLLTRNLLTYKHVAGTEGNVLVPDLATEVPAPQDGGRVWEFELKEGITFGPPVSREITAEDVEYAFERIATPELSAQYGFYYTPVIEGMQDFEDGKAKDISGIEADGNTIRFTLTEPVGDFLYRVAMPATSPMPEEVAGCFNAAGEYGRYVISSGPYMLEGADELDASSCKALKQSGPISGFDPNRFMNIVRNPDYDAATDSPEVRQSLPDRFEFEINTNLDDIFAKIEAGEVDGTIDTPTPEIVRDYSTDEEKTDLMKISDADRTWYITMNLTQPPFDDVNVRKAVNLVMDKDSLRRAWGGPTAGDIATHIVPPEVTGGQPTAEEFDPYQTPDYAGDVEAAKEAMSQSKYDTDGDGVCDAPECSGLLMINRNVTPWTEMEPVVQDSLQKIGIEIEPRELESGTAYTTIQTVDKNIPIALNAGWGKDYADASTFAVLFETGSITCEGNVNYSLVGLTPALAKECGAEGSVSNVPNATDQIDPCKSLLEQERVDCWVEADQYLMEEVVPWVPYLWASNIDIVSEAVTQYEYDQFSGEASYSHVAVDESLQN
jgi:peptide/nickel transport system substrate-binding protein